MEHKATVMCLHVCKYVTETLYETEHGMNRVEISNTALPIINFPGKKIMAQNVMLNQKETLDDS